MKSTLTIFILLCISCVVHAQFPSSNIQATKVDLKDTNNNVIGNMVVIPGLSRDMFLSYYSKKDSSGFLVTEYKFIQRTSPSAKSVIIIFQSANFKTVDYSIEGDSAEFKTNIDPRDYSTSISISDLKVNAVVAVRFESKKNLVPTITGVSGELDLRKTY